MHLLNRVQAVYSLNKSSITNDNTVYCVIKSGNKELSVTYEHLSFIAKYCDCKVQDVKDSIDSIDSIDKMNTPELIQDKNIKSSFQELLNQKAKIIKEKNQ